MSSAASDIGLTAARELRKNLRSAKGIAMLALFLLGGVGGSLIYLQASKFVIEKATRGAEVSAEAMRMGKLDLLKNIYPEATANYLVDCPMVLLFLFRGTLVAVPFLTLLAGFDLVAGEAQHRTMRYLVGRSTRPSIIAGKALGLWVMVSAMVLALHVVVWLIALGQGEGTAAQIASWGPRWWLLSLACTACFAGITTFLSACFRTPAVVLFVGVAALIGMALAWLILSNFASTEQISYVLPWAYGGLLVSHDPLRAFGAVGALLAWAGVTVGLASEIVRRKDI